MAEKLRVKTSKTKRAVSSSTPVSTVTTTSWPTKKTDKTTKSWSDLYAEKAETIEFLLWGSRHCGQLRGGTLGTVKSVLKESGPDGLLLLPWLGPDVGKKKLVNDLHKLLKA